MNNLAEKHVEFSVKPLHTSGQYYGFSLEKNPLYTMPDGTIFHNSGKSVLEQSM